MQWRDSAGYFQASLYNGKKYTTINVPGAAVNQVQGINTAGDIAYFISDPVLTGFKTGAALYIASTQLPKLFGLEGVTGNFFERLFHVLVSLPETHVPSFLFGLAAIVLFILFERLLPGRPTTLIVVIAAIAVMTIFGLSETSIKIVGDLPSGLPEISLPSIYASDISALIPVALACFVLAYGESISVARSFAQKHGYGINPEQELTALGAANIATASHSQAAGQSRQARRTQKLSAVLK